MYINLTVGADSGWDVDIFKDEDKRIVLYSKAGVYLSMNIDEARRVAEKIVEAINGKSRDWGEYYGKK